MRVELFRHQLVHAMTLPPPERHRLMSQLHTHIYEAYCTAISAMSAQRAAQEVTVGNDVRTVLQVVGHIHEWERFAILGACDILAGLDHPRMVTDIKGYVEPDGQERQFESIDAFNDYQAERHLDWPWQRMQAAALQSAATLHALFTDPRLVNAQRLEQTQPFRKRLQDGTRISDITMGWNLWITVIEHEGVEHAKELGLPL
jgi:hypothetical protein